MRKVHTFLSARRTEAFDASELVAALGGPAILMTEREREAADYISIMQALSKLEEIGAIELRKVSSNEYYAYSSDLPQLR